jgi:2,4'-dihydroxyacetophenone dioxygenase
MMNYEKITTSYIDAESYPWIPFVPYFNDTVFLKVLKAEPISGTFITLLRAPGTITLPKHHHCGIVIVYTIKGNWKYKEHQWTAVEGSVVYETAATSHTPVGAGDGEVITLNIQVGDSIYLDDQGKVLAIENWKTMLERYVNYCKGNGITPIDITDFSE